MSIPITKFIGIKKKKRRNEISDCFNISSAVNFVLNEKKSRVRRAVRLYELQIAINTGIALNKRQARNNSCPECCVMVPRTLISSASVLASVEILKSIDAELREIHQEKYKSGMLFKHEEGQKILRRIMLTPKGLDKIGFSLRSKAFDGVLRDLRRRQECFTPLYDISLRFTTEPNSKRTGGRTTAREILKQKKNSKNADILRKHYPNVSSLTTIDKYRKGKDILAAFLWLDDFDGAYLRPSMTNNASFAYDLLAKVEDLTALRYFFGRYAAVSSRLSERRYDLVQLEFSSPPERYDMPFPALDDELQALD